MSRTGALLLIVATAVVGGGLSTAATSTTAPPNNGLPHQWFGITKWKSALPGPIQYTTFANVTLTLTKKLPYRRAADPPISRGYDLGATGTSYGYSPSGKITVTGECATPVVGHLKAHDGGLAIDVETGKGKVHPAAYWGEDAMTLQEDIPQRCPNGYATDIGPLYWGFRTTPDFGPILRRMSTSAKKIEGEYVDHAVTHAKYEWCFVRSRKDLLSCGYLVEP